MREKWRVTHIGEGWVPSCTRLFLSPFHSISLFGHAPFEDGGMNGEGRDYYYYNK